MHISWFTQTRICLCGSLFHELSLRSPSESWNFDPSVSASKVAELLGVNHCILRKLFPNIFLRLSRGWLTCSCMIALFYWFFLCVREFCQHLCLCTVCVWCLQRPEESFGSLGTGLTVKNWDAMLETEHGFSGRAVEPSLQPLMHDLVPSCIAIWGLLLPKSCRSLDSFTTPWCVSNTFWVWETVSLMVAFVFFIFLFLFIWWHL